MADDYEDTPLMAAYGGRMDFIVPFVRDRGNELYANSNGDTLLHAAAEGWQYRMAEFLMISGAENNAQNEQGDTPLHSLIRSSKLPCEGRFLLDSDQLSARSATFTTLELRGADTGIRNIQGATPLHLAANLGDLFAINWLARAANIDELTTKGATPLLLSIFQGHAHCAERLIQLGANPDFTLPGGYSVMDYIRRYNGKLWTR